MDGFGRNPACSRRGESDGRFSRSSLASRASGVLTATRTSPARSVKRNSTRRSPPLTSSLMSRASVRGFQRGGFWNGWRLFGVLDWIGRGGRVQAVRSGFRGRMRRIEAWLVSGAAFDCSDPGSGDADSNACFSGLLSGGGSTEVDGALLFGKLAAAGSDADASFFKSPCTTASFLIGTRFARTQGGS